MDANPPGLLERVQKLQARELQQAVMFALMIEVASDTFPEELRKSLGKVFDLSCIEETTRRLMLVVTECQEASVKARDYIQELRKEVQSLRDEIGWTKKSLEELKRANKTESNGRARQRYTESGIPL